LVRPPCRFEQVEREGLTIVLDVAHNPDAMEYLVRKLKNTYPDASFRFVVGMSSDKDLSKCAQSILSMVAPNAIHLVEAAHPRAAKLGNIMAAEPRLKGCYCDMEDRSITKQVLKAVALAREQGEILIVCGSVFLMAEAREALGFDEPRDSDSIAEVAGSGIRHSQENFGDSNSEKKK
jgi:dihydrofolate synthase/folylpolyglutamate synthase